ncbi:phosphatidylinositol-specific phospholipase C/glycerophosphodiester phosphodiesterase family protein [Paenibacillus sp. FSL L8-0470]|uniref:phosphatidylinositol-specific phospholipase C/glycerophosphodiester phosphodiesterase family protein n=1 Tax=unclassified Paenibacillus TaxID=185978 RepID=UPI0030F58648
MDKKKSTASVIMVIAIVLLLVITLTPEDKEPAAGFAAHRIVAHAMGGINGHAYTNAVEGFIANYEQGTRIFEADLLFTGDQKLVARHEWSRDMTKQLGQKEVLPADKEGEVLDYAEFMDSPILGLYSPADIEKIMDLMMAYPDAYIVTDTKEVEAELVTQQFEVIVEAAERRDPSLLKRIVPQIYSREMLDMIRKVHVFPEVIYTLYQSEDSDEVVTQFVKETGANITMPDDRATKSFVQKLKRAGARVYVHTINDEKEIVQLSRLGVDGFYTDFVSEDDMERLGGLGRN